MDQGCFCPMSHVSPSQMPFEEHMRSSTRRRFREFEADPGYAFGPLARVSRLIRNWSR